MLLEIAIRNIALIDELRLELGPGLNVLTGETGAGKSIVVGALTLVLGGRADKGLLRTGTERARVEAVFDISNSPEARGLLREWEIEADEDIVIVARELSDAGRSACRVCGVTVPLNQFRRLTGLLVELHGQREHQLLCDPSRHTAFLDAYGDEAHHNLLKRTGELYAEYARLGREAGRLRGDLSERERLRDMLSFQIGEIDAVKPKPNEMDKLEKKNALLRSAEKIAHNLGRAYDLVYRGAGRGPSAQESLKKASDAMAALEGLDESFDKIKSRLDELYYLAEDVGYELQDLVGGMEFDPAEADRIGARLSELKGLTRKYGPELSDVIEFRARAGERLEEIEGGEDKLREIERETDKARSALLECCEKLTRSRARLAAALGERVQNELSQLGMARARFETRFNKLGPDKYSPEGAERAEFMLSANPGEPVKPLSDVASGGELSRIMLAMKVVAADKAGVDAMVFDEIDTGISGRMAQVVGEKMAAIARERQVISVTHLPQIASLGDRQYLVEKKVEGGRTGSTVRLLDRAGRVEELARMVGGAADIASARAHAANLLDAAQALAASMRKQIVGESER